MTDNASELRSNCLSLFILISRRKSIKLNSLTLKWILSYGSYDLTCNILDDRYETDVVCGMFANIIANVAKKHRLNRWCRTNFCRDIASPDLNITIFTLYRNAAAVIMLWSAHVLGLSIDSKYCSIFWSVILSHMSAFKSGLLWMKLNISLRIVLTSLCALMQLCINSWCPSALKKHDQSGTVSCTRNLGNSQCVFISEAGAVKIKFTDY